MNSIDKTKVDLALDMIREDRQRYYGGMVWTDSLYGRASPTTFTGDECQTHLFCIARKGFPS